eukprot:m.472704 g.472704  ORF g.472704 m.472704 type:complete len:220 (-) comp33155_c0_seq1:155-814(-)
MNDLCIAYDEVGEIEVAQEMTQELLERQRRMAGSTHPSTLATITSMTATLMKLERFDEAASLASEALESYREVKGARHPCTIHGMGNVGIYTALAGGLVAAEKILREAIETARTIPGFEAQLMFFLRASLGFALSGLAQHDEAVKILREAHASQLQADAIEIEHGHTLRTAGEPCPWCHKGRLNKGFDVEVDTGYADPCVGCRCVRYAPDSQAVDRGGL